MIRWYPRGLSPLKGFACAYRIRTGEPSCSTVIREGVLREGPWRAASLARAQFARCREAYLSLQMSDFRPPAQGTVATKKRRRRAKPASCRSRSPAATGGISASAHRFRLIIRVTGSPTSPVTPVLRKWRVAPLREGVSERRARRGGGGRSEALPDIARAGRSRRSGGGTCRGTRRWGRRRSAPTCSRRGRGSPRR